MRHRDGAQTAGALDVGGSGTVLRMRVDAGTVDASPLRDRLVLRHPGQLSSAGPAGVVEAPGLGHAVERSLSRLWGLFGPGAVHGPAALVEPPPFLAALRNLVDGILAPALGSAAGLAVTVDPDSELWAAIYPDALGEPPSASALTIAATPPPRLLVILGCGRSGTTWLERLLMAHPLAGGAEATESFVFAQCTPLWDEVERADGLGRWLGADAIGPLLRGFCDALFAATLDRHRPGATVMVEKTPRHSLLLPQVCRVYPDAHYLHLVRDGRDVARSASQVPFFRCPTPADGAAMWTHVLREVRATAPSLAHYREIRYEDLVEDPGGVTAALWEWSGLSPNDATEAELATRAGVRVSSHAGTAHAVGSETWRVLSRPQLAAVYAEAGHQLVREGYATAADIRLAQRDPAYWSRRLHRLRRVLSAKVAVRDRVRRPARALRRVIPPPVTRRLRALRSWARSGPGVVDPVTPSPPGLPGGALDCVVAFNRHGVYCLPRSSMHRPASKATLAGDVWEPDTIELLRAADSGGDIVHAGSFFGDFLPALARSRQPGALVWAFEPNRENHRCAQVTTILNDLSNVVLAHAALGAGGGAVRLVTTDPAGRSLGGGSHVVGERSATMQATEEVALVAIDDVVGADRPVAVIQLDVEGFERQALEGALATIERCRPLLVLENLPDEVWVEAHLAQLGYRLDGRVHDNTVLRCGDRRSSDLSR